MRDNATPPSDAQAPSDGLPPIINSAEFLANELPLPKSLIKGVLDVGGKMVLGAGSKSYKTWIVADMATAIASGTPWLGLETNQARVLFLNFEIPAPFFQRRLDAVLKAKDLPPTTKANLDVWNLRGHGGNYKILMPKMQKRIKDRGFDLVLADPAYKLYGNLKENEPGALGEFFNAGEELATVCNVGLLLSAHFSKGNQSLKDAIDRVSGSGVWGRDPDTFVAVTPHQTQGAFTIDLTMRNHPELKAFAVRWKFPVMERDEGLDPALLREPPKPGAARIVKYTAEHLFKLLAAQGPFATVGDFYDAAHGDGFVSKGDFKKLLVKLRAMKGVRVEKGMWLYGG